MWDSEEVSQGFIMGHRESRSNGNNSFSYINGKSEMENAA